MNKLKSTTEELGRDEEGIKLLQKMVDDRKNDVSKLATQVQQEKSVEQTLQASLKAESDQKLAIANKEKEFAAQKEQLNQKVTVLESELMTQKNATKSLEITLVQEQNKTANLTKELQKEKSQEAAKETETNFVLQATLDSLKQYKKQEEIKD